MVKLHCRCLLVAFMFDRQSKKIPIFLLMFSRQSPVHPREPTFFTKRDRENKSLACVWGGVNVFVRERERERERGRVKIYFNFQRQTCVCWKLLQHVGLACSCLSLSLPTFLKLKINFVDKQFWRFWPLQVPFSSLPFSTMDTFTNGVREELSDSVLFFKWL